MNEPLEFVIWAGDCPCPDKPHTEERVFLEPELTLAMASAGMAALRETTTKEDVEAELTEAFLPRAIRSWSFLELGTEDDKGRRPVRSVEITRENFERLVPFDKGGYELIEKAGELYLARFMRPLVARMSRLSQLGSTDDSMPRSPRTGGRRQAPSSPSSPTNGAGKQSGVQAR